MAETMTREPGYLLLLAAAFKIADPTVEAALLLNLLLTLGIAAMLVALAKTLTGDQVLRGLRAFKPGSSAQELFASDLHPHLGAARQTYSRILGTHPLTFAAFRQAPWHHHGLRALEQTQLSMRSPYLDNDVVRTLFRAPEAVTRK
jgi:hypothetical protein